MRRITRELARYVHPSRYDALPAAVRREGVRAFVNWVGCAAGGSREANVAHVLAVLHEFNGAVQPFIQITVFDDSGGFNKDPAFHRSARDVEFTNMRFVKCRRPFDRIKADNEGVLPDANTHVAIQQESDPTEHLFLGDASRPGKPVTNPSRK